MIQQRIALLLLTCAGLAVGGDASAAGHAFVWADQPTTVRYTPSAAYSHNPAGGAVEISRAGVGRYRVRFAGMSLEGGNVQVTAYGSSFRSCQVQRWSGDSVHVRCFGRAGHFADTRFTLLYLSPPLAECAARLAANTAWTEEPRAGVSFMCSWGETLEGIFYHDHPRPYTDWIDAVGAICGARGTSRRLFNEKDVPGLDPAGDVTLSCPDGEVPRGIGATSQLINVAGGLTRLGGVTLLCGPDSTPVPHADVDPSDPTWTTTECAPWETMVGVAYKDDGFPDGTWSDATIAVVPVCAPLVCE